MVKEIELERHPKADVAQHNRTNKGKYERAIGNLPQRFEHVQRDNEP